jgi:hypothetical protein
MAEPYVQQIDWEPVIDDDTWFMNPLTREWQRYSNSIILPKDEALTNLDLNPKKAEFLTHLLIEPEGFANSGTDRIFAFIDYAAYLGDLVPVLLQTPHLGQRYRGNAIFYEANEQNQFADLKVHPSINAIAEAVNRVGKAYYYNAGSIRRSLFSTPVRRIFPALMKTK